jgi:peptidase C39-like protein
MKQKVALAVLSFSILALIAGCCRPGLSGDVPNTLRPQETNNWCWAAVTQMLGQHLGIQITQCKLANMRWGGQNEFEADCCTEQTAGKPCPKTNDCDMPSAMNLRAIDAQSSRSSTALSWSNLRSQIVCAGKPMGYSYGTKNAVGHIVVIRGYTMVFKIAAVRNTGASVSYVVLNDPAPACSGQQHLITYAEYADPAGSATHWVTYYDIARQ